LLRFINTVFFDIASYLFLRLNIKNTNSVPLILLNDDH